MISKTFPKLKRIAILCLIFSLLLTCASCNIVRNKDLDDDSSTNLYEGDLSNGVITQGIVEANFTVKLISDNVSVLGNVINESLSQGSGVVFERQSVEGGYQYAILTNNHVVYKDTVNFRRFDFSVRDCYGKSYPAQVVTFDPNYDLAVVTFTSETYYKSLEFATKNPQVEDSVVSIGQPQGIINAVTEGKVTNYMEVTVPTENGAVNPLISNVNFDVIKHSAPINQGSSGGVLLDKDYNICGINYAAAVVEDSTEFVSGYAIPVNKVKQFLTEKYYLL